MGLKDMFKKRDSLIDELQMLPRDTKEKILRNVNRRRSQIIEERLLENQLNGMKQDNKKKRGGLGKFREGMKRRREELKAKGIIQPPIRYNKQNFRSPMEEMSKQSRRNEIKMLENQRDRLKSGCKLEDKSGFKLKELKLKIPKADSKLLRVKKINIKNGII